METPASRPTDRAEYGFCSAISNRSLFFFRIMGYDEGQTEESDLGDSCGNKNGPDGNCSDAFYSS